MVVGGAFVAVIAYIMIATSGRRAQPTYAPSPIAFRQIPAETTVVDTLTIDARDDRFWRFVDFDRRSEVVPPDTSGWDVAIRRFHIIAADAVADVGAVPFEAAAPPDSGYTANRIARDTTNPAIRRWYRYSFITHLLEPNGHVYAVRTRDGRYAVLEVLSYYCPGLTAGCVTLRYRYPS